MKNKKTEGIITGRELRIAAKKGLMIRYVEKFYNPEDKCKDFDDYFIMEKCNSVDLDMYYIGNSDISLEDFKDDDIVAGDFPEGFFEVRRAKGVIYK